MMSDELAREIFFKIHTGLSREAPGGVEHTERALSMLPDLQRPCRVLDIGCGPGAQSLVIAQHLDSQLVSVDNHEPFLADLRSRAKAAGLADRIETCSGDMTDLRFDAGSFDLLWSEGSIYVMGFENGLQSWRPLLREGGCIALTEAVWLSSSPPSECLAFWDAAYPGMTDIESNVATAKACGYRHLGGFVLPTSAWWDGYYSPVEVRLLLLEERYAGNRDALALIAAERQEIEMYRRYSDHYGYAFFILQRDDV